MGKTLLVANREFRKLVFTPGVLLTFVILVFGMLLGFSVPFITQSTEPVKYIGVINQYDDDFIPRIDRELDTGHRVKVLNTWDLYVRILAETQPGLVEALPDYLRPQYISDERLDRFSAAGGVETANAIVKQHLSYAGVVPDFTPPKRTVYLLDLPVSPPPLLPLDPLALPVPAPDHSDQSGSGHADQSEEDLRAIIKPWITGERLIAGPAGEREVTHVLVVRGKADDVPSLDYWFASSGQFPIGKLIEETVEKIATKRAFSKIGVSDEQFDEASSFSVEVEEFILNEEGEKTDLSVEDFLREKLPFAFAYVLFFAVFSGGQYLLMSVIEEKSNKIAEVLLSSVSPSQLMMGKLIGNFLASMTFMALLLILGIGISFAVAPVFSEQISVTKILFSGSAVYWLMFCFMFGYGFIAAIYLAIGSMCSSIEDAQSFLGPFMIVFLAPLVLLIPVIQNPNGLIASIMSFIPLYSPYVLMIRVSNDPPIWEMIAGSGVLVISTVIMIYAMGRIFRKFILGQGLTLRWGRASGPR